MIFANLVDRENQKIICKHFGINTVSAMEQLHFLKAMLSNELPIKSDAIANTKKNMYQGKLDNGADYYGKTGIKNNISDKLDIFYARILIIIFN